MSVNGSHNLPFLVGGSVKLLKRRAPSLVGERDSLIYHKMTTLVDGHSVPNSQAPDSKYHQNCAMIYRKTLSNNDRVCVLRTGDML